ncbi:sugar transferase [Agrilactobacillus yilanensis]|uniref:Sugar transferase n=1 Tax=Agrilactobacillus yilanensis TaxID=2485997 RepID=A0ABW4J7Z6_9LACO
MEKKEVIDQYTLTTVTELRQKHEISWLYQVIKRVLDIILSLLALTVLVPFFIVLFCCYRIGDNHGPMFYKQPRVGRNGKIFQIYKFRSMVVNADEILQSDSALYQKYVLNNYKLNPEEDPRITKLGRMLRQRSIDELPQFINILKGEMSLVGPRPVIEAELEEYGDQAETFLSVTPGAMGYWQAHGRSNIPYPYRVNYELYYVDHACFRLDLQIVFKNIISIFKKDGAY